MDTVVVVHVQNEKISCKLLRGEETGRGRGTRGLARTYRFPPLSTSVDFYQTKRTLYVRSLIKRRHSFCGPLSPSNHRYRRAPVTTSRQGSRHLVITASNRVSVYADVGPPSFMFSGPPYEGRKFLIGTRETPTVSLKLVNRSRAHLPYYLRGRGA